MISAKKLKRSMQWGCQMFPISMSDLAEGESLEVSLDDHPLLQDFANVFLSEIPSMLPKCDINFHINLVPRVEPISQASYRITT